MFTYLIQPIKSNKWVKYDILLLVKKRGSML